MACCSGAHRLRGWFFTEPVPLSAPASLQKHDPETFEVTDAYQVWVAAQDTINEDLPALAAALDAEVVLPLPAMVLTNKQAKLALDAARLLDCSTKSTPLWLRRGGPSRSSGSSHRP